MNLPRNGNTDSSTSSIQSRGSGVRLQPELGASPRFVVGNNGAMSLNLRMMSEDSQSLLQNEFNCGALYYSRFVSHNQITTRGCFVATTHLHFCLSP